jgi:hypothetical protein
MDNTTYVNRKRMEEDIQKHIGYRTAWIVKDGDKIVAFLRVNIMPNPKEAHVID